MTEQEMLAQLSAHVASLGFDAASVGDYGSGKMQRQNAGWHWRGPLGFYQLPSRKIIAALHYFNKRYVVDTTGMSLDAASAAVGHVIRSDKHVGYVKRRQQMRAFSQRGANGRCPTCNARRVRGKRGICRMHDQKDARRYTNYFNTEARKART